MPQHKARTIAALQWPSASRAPSRPVISNQSSSMRKKNRKWVFLIAALALIAGGYYAKRVWVKPKPVATYATAPVARGDVEKTVLASGKLEALQQVNVGAQVSGQVKRLAVELGQQVKAGDLIAEIDSLTQQNALRNAEAALTTAKADLAAQKAGLAQAKAAYQRQKQMRAADANSQADLDAAEQAYKVAQASVQSQQARVAQAGISADTARLNLGYTRIVAPMDGQVVAVVTKEGQTVNANQSAPTIIVLAQLDTMTVKAEISEADVPHVKPGQPVYFTILGEPAKRYEATLRNVEPGPTTLGSTTAATTNNTAAQAIYYNGLFDVPNPAHTLRIAMTAQVNIVLGAARDVLTIPTSALGARRGDGSYTVRVLAADGTAQPRQVQIGLNNNVSAEVKSGLQEGEQVIVADSAQPSAARTPRGPGIRM